MGSLGMQTIKYGLMPLCILEQISFMQEGSTMLKQPADTFYQIADEFISFITGTELSEQSAERLITLLMALYIAALELPDADPETEDAHRGSEFPQIRISKRLKTTYWEVFDPFENKEPVCSDLYDDIRDIAKDLLDGMEEYDAGRPENAVFEWRFGLNNHWGSHAVDAIRALHALRT